MFSEEISQKSTTINDLTTKLALSEQQVQHNNLQLESLQKSISDKGFQLEKNNQIDNLFIGASESDLQKEIETLRQQLLVTQTELVTRDGNYQWHNVFMVTVHLGVISTLKEKITSYDESFKLKEQHISALEGNLQVTNKLVKILNGNTRY